MELRLGDAIFNNSTVLVTGAADVDKVAVIEMLAENIPSNHKVTMYTGNEMSTNCLKDVDSALDLLVESLRKDTDRAIHYAITNENIFSVYEQLASGLPVIGAFDTDDYRKVPEQLVKCITDELDRLHMQYDEAEIYMEMYASVDYIVHVVNEGEDTVIHSVYEPHPNISTVLYRTKSK